MPLIDSFTEDFKANGTWFAAPVLKVDDSTVKIALKDEKTLSIGQTVERKIDGTLYFVVSGPRETPRGYFEYEMSCNKQMVSVLGSVYAITRSHSPGDNRLDDKDGFCDETTHEIVVESYEGEDGKPDSKAQLDVQRKKILRHEIVHAFAFESGLAENSPWAQNEEMVDWIAIQGPKIYKVWQEAGAL